MTHRRLFPERHPRTRRWLIPTAFLLGLSALLFGASISLAGFENAGFYRLAMNGVHLLLFIVVAFGTLAIYPWMCFRGASLPERICGSLITPLAFVIKELIRVHEYFTWGEALYYAVSPVMLLLMLGQIGLMGIAEMVCRATGKGKIISGSRIVSLGPVAAIIAALAALYVFLFWGMGVHWFYIYMQGYKALFL